MKKILRKGLPVCLICLILFSCSSCKSVKWDWKANPYSADHVSQSVYSAYDEVIGCHEEQFSDMTCFSYQDMESLIFNIKRLQRAISNLRISSKSKRSFIHQTNKIIKELPKRAQDN